MPIDRRITNGLAWAGAVLVIAIPAADIAMRQFAPAATPQVAVVDPQVEAEAPDAVEPSLPTPVAQRPQPAPVSAAPEPEPEPEPAVAAPDPVVTAAATGQGSTDDPVDTFISSGRQLPSYISDSGSTAPARPAQEATAGAPAAAVPPAATPTRPAIAVPSAAAAPEQVANAPRTRIVTFPTPVSERPASVPRSQVAAQPPLIIDQAPPAPVLANREPPMVTADDLEDWESGPLSEFLARRQGQSTGVSSDFDPNGFFLDEGPNSSARYQRVPRAYGGEFYPFE